MSAPNPSGASRVSLLAALLVLLPAAWWYPLLLGRLPDFMDTVTYLYPLRMAAARQLWDHATLPLWLPEQFAGTPLAANPQVALWYPPQWLFVIFPGAWMYGVLAVAHVVWGGAGAWVYLRAHGCRPSAALLGGLTFQFSAMMVGRMALMPHVWVGAWIPWLLWAIDRTVADPGRHSAGKLAAVTAMLLLAGSPQLAYYAALGATVYLAARLLVGTVSSPAAEPPRSRALYWAAAGAFLGAILALVQVLPVLEFLGEAQRQRLAPERLAVQALNGSMIARSLVGLTGGAVEDTDSCNALSWGALLLLPFALALRGSRRAALPLLLFGVVGFVLALGVLVPILCAALPLYSGFHAPRRALMLWSVAAPLLAGLGAERWLAQRSAGRWPTVALFAAFALGLAPFLSRLERAFTATEHLEVPAEVASVFATGRLLSVDPTFNFSYDSRRPDYGVSLVPNTAALAGLRDAQGYDPLYLRSIGHLRDAVCRTSGVFWPSHAVYFTDPGSPLLRLVAVRYVVGRYDLLDPGRVIPGARVETERLRAQLRPVYLDPKWPIHEFTEPRPLAWTVERVERASSPAAALDVAQDLDLSRQVVTVSGPALTAEHPAPVAEVFEVHPRRVEIRFAEPAATRLPLVVALPRASGWTARDNNGRPVPLHDACGVVTLADVPPGARSVTLTYFPRGFQWGSVFSLAGLMALLALLFPRSWRRGSSRLAGQPAPTGPPTNSNSGTHS